MKAESRTLPRFYVVSAGHSAHVVDSSRLNEWGERWVEDAWLTHEQADARAKQLNAQKE